MYGHNHAIGMSEATKSAVLAKCEEAKNHKAHFAAIDDYFTVVYWVDDGCVDWYRIATEDIEDVCVRFSEYTPADDPRWQLAADILKITPTIDEFESDLSRRQYHHDLEVARMEGYEQGKAEAGARPSDALLWEAYFEAAKMFIGKTGVNYGNIAELASAEFSAWLATIPPDTLKADRELVKNIFRVSNTVKVSRGTKLWETIARLSGMEVGNG